MIFLLFAAQFSITYETAGRVFFRTHKHYFQQFFTGVPERELLKAFIFPYISVYFQQNLKSYI